MRSMNDHGSTRRFLQMGLVTSGAHCRWLRLPVFGCIMGTLLLMPLTAFGQTRWNETNSAGMGVNPNGGRAVYPYPTGAPPKSWPVVNNWQPGVRTAYNVPPINGNVATSQAPPYNNYSPAAAAIAYRAPAQVAWNQPVVQQVGSTMPASRNSTLMPSTGTTISPVTRVARVPQSCCVPAAVPASGYQLGAASQVPAYPVAATPTGPFRPLLPLKPIPPGAYLGQGIIGQPTAYVNGQPLRNMLRYISP